MFSLGLSNEMIRFRSPSHAQKGGRGDIRSQWFNSIPCIKRTNNTGSIEVWCGTHVF